MAPPKTATKLSLAVQSFERMRAEVAAIGHAPRNELMRAVEVSFIRDCAEMASRSSLTRDESRWGSDHDRSDAPGRDDEGWRYHLNLQAADGSMGSRSVRWHRISYRYPNSTDCPAVRPSHYPSPSRS